MIKFNGKEYRNLEEQVLENTQAIKEIHDIGLLLAQLGIKVVGQVDTAAELPDATAYYPDDRENHYGDAFAVGTMTPYYFYLFTRPFEGETDPKWFSIGKFPMPGPKGDPGSGGGAAYTSARIDIDSFVSPDLKGNLTLIDSDNQETVLPLATNMPWAEGEGISLVTDSATGITRPSVDLWRHHITMSENQTVGQVRYEGLLVEFDIISSKSGAITSWNNFCTALARRSTSTLRINVSGKRYYSPSPELEYSQFLINRIAIDPQAKTLTAFGYQIWTSDPDNPLADWHIEYNTSQCSFMAFSDSVRPFPDVTSIN